MSVAVQSKHYAHNRLECLKIVNGTLSIEWNNNLALIANRTIVIFFFSSCIDFNLGLKYGISFVFFDLFNSLILIGIILASSNDLNPNTLLPAKYMFIWRTIYTIAVQWTQLI